MELISIALAFLFAGIYIIIGIAYWETVKHEYDNDKGCMLIITFMWFSIFMAWLLFKVLEE